MSKVSDRKVTGRPSKGSVSPTPASVAKRSPDSGTRARIVREALRLFAEQGFAGTRVTDIETAAGLSAGSGAIYTYFGSKEDVLAAVLAEADAGVEAAIALFEMVAVDDLRTELLLLGRGMLATFTAWDSLIGVMLKEAERFPHLVAPAREQILDQAHVWLSGWLGQQVDRGRLAEHDSEAVASAAIGALLYQRLLTSRFGGTPQDVSDERFVATWVDLIANLGPRPAEP